MALLAETRDGLKEILKTNQDILEELDKLEEKQRQRREKILKSRSEGDVSPTKEEAGKSGRNEEMSEHSMKPHKHQDEHSDDTGGRTAKKAARFALKPEMREYCRLLKHCVTPVHQDNRMCEKFNIPPHRGAVDRRQAGQTDGQKKVQHLALPAKPRAVGQGRTKSQDTGTQPTQVTVKQDASPSLPDQLATMLDPEKLIQMGGLQQMMGGVTMAINPSNGMMQVIGQEEIQSMKERAEAAGQQVVIISHDIQTGCMKLVSGREFLQDISSMLTEENLAELDQPERDLLLANNKVLSLFTSHDSVPWSTYMQAYMGALQTGGIQEQVLTGAQAFMAALQDPSRAVSLSELLGSLGTQQTTQHKPIPPSSGSQKSKSSSSTSSGHKSKPSSAATKSHQSKPSSASSRDQQQSRSSDKDSRSSRSTRTKPSSSLTSPNVTPQRSDTQSSQHKQSVSQVSGETGSSSQGKGTSPGMQQSQGAKSEASQSQAGARSDTQQSGGGVSSQSGPAISHVSPVMGLQQSAGQVRADFVRTGGQATAREKEVEPVYIDDSMWSDVANQQVAEGERARNNRERGMDTIICLDLSESMKGEPWKQAKAFIQGFIEGIQNTTLMDDVYEHVGLVTFGSETRVQQHMTCDYVEVTRKLGKLSPAGPSPLWAGMTMLYAAMNGSGATFCANGYKIQPRVFLLTDCQPTASNMIAGPDRCLKGEQALEKFKVVELVANLHKKIQFTMNVVPVGDFDSDLCVKLSSMTGGKVVMPTDSESVTRTFRNYLAATKLGPLLKMGSPELAHLWMDTLGGGSSQQDKMEMEEFLKNHKQESTEDSDSEDLPQFPSLGSRVKRNPLIYRPGMTHRVGTVTKHMHDGHIGVTWDEPDEVSGENEKVEYSDSRKGVLPCDQPRMLKDELIAVGCRVRRGKDWRSRYSDQDGGAGKLGSVFNVQPSGIIRVRWDNGHRNTYRFGEDGIYFDVEIVEEVRNPDRKDEEKNEPVDLIEEMNRKNAARSQNIMDSIAPGTRSSSRDYASDTETISATRKNKEAGVTRAMTPDTHSGRTDADVAGARTMVSGRGKTDGVTRAMTPDTYSGRADALVADARTVVSGRDVREERKVSDTAVAAPRTGSGTGGADNGARPKAVLAPEEIKWRWNNNGVWEVYPPEVCGKIETSFRRNPRGTALIQVGDTQFRVVFSRMEQINVQSRDKYPVCRD